MCTGMPPIRAVYLAMTSGGADATFSKMTYTGVGKRLRKSAASLCRRMGLPGPLVLQAFALDVQGAVALTGRASTKDGCRELPSLCSLQDHPGIHLLQ